MATTDIYTLSLHDALPILPVGNCRSRSRMAPRTSSDAPPFPSDTASTNSRRRSEEHTSELQSQFHIVCRLLLEKKMYSIDHANLSFCHAVDAADRKPLSLV